MTVIRMRGGAVALGLLLLLAGCASEPGPAGSLADPSSPVFKIKQHYEARATEDNGRCKSVLFEDATQVDVLEDTAEQLVMRVRYAYASASGGSARRSPTACQGFGTRVFSLAKTPEGLRVVEMSDRIA